MSGLIVCGILQLIVAITYDKKPGAKVTGQVLVALSCLYMMSYNVRHFHRTRVWAICLQFFWQGMISTYAWVSGGELPSQRLRSYTFGLAAAIGFFGAWLTTFTAPYFINPESLNWGPRYGYIWFPSCVVAALWVYFFLPEVKGRTLEEIDEMVRIIYLLMSFGLLLTRLPCHSSKQSCQPANSGPISVLALQQLS